MAVLLSLNEVPASKLTGLNAIAGDRLAESSGMLNFNPVSDVVNVNSSSVNLAPDTAYKIAVTSSAFTLNALPPASDKWGLEGHIELFVAGAGYVQAGSNVKLASAIQPDAVNYCTVRFRNGIAVVSVDDHIYGYTVTVNASSGAGSLAYGLSTATNEYISVDASLNGQTLNLSGVTTYAGAKRIVGNGYDETFITGGITCTNITTFSYLSLQDVTVAGGTAYLSDVNIPSGSTVGASGGTIYIETNGIIRGTGVISSTINFNGGPNSLISGITVRTGGAGIYSTYKTGKITIDNAQISGNVTAIYLNQSWINAVITGSTISGNTTTATGAAFNAQVMSSDIGTVVSFENCLFKDNISTGYPNANCIVANNSTVSISGCTFSENENCFFNNTMGMGKYTYAGTNYIRGTVSGNTGASVNIAAGTVLDLTGNTHTTVFNPAGGVIVDGGCQVITSGGATVSIVAGTYTQINNDGTTE